MWSSHRILERRYGNVAYPTHPSRLINQKALYTLHVLHMEIFFFGTSLGLPLLNRRRSKILCEKETNVYLNFILKNSYYRLALSY